MCKPDQDLIQQALDEGVPLYKIEEHLDWLENVARANPPPSGTTEEKT